MTGVVKKILTEKGFGFIRDEAGKEYFFHRSAVVRPATFEGLYEGTDVEFEVEPSAKGPRATQVRLG